MSLCLPGKCKVWSSVPGSREKKKKKKFLTEELCDLVKISCCCRMLLFVGLSSFKKDD